MCCIKCKTHFRWHTMNTCVIQLTEHTNIIQRTILYHFVSSNICNIQYYRCNIVHDPGNPDPEFYNAKN